MIGGLAVGIAAAAWLLYAGFPRLARQTAPAGLATGSPTSGAERQISATLYYVSHDGLSLDTVKRDVRFGEAVADQARHIVEAQLAESAAPLLSAIPAGTALRAVFVNERGDAFVDLSADVTSKHTGGSLDELFTVYTIVNALTENLPAVKRVQILVDGKEVDTLAGHVDLRHPLQKSLKWVKTENEGS